MHRCHGRLRFQAIGARVYREISSLHREDEGAAAALPGVEGERTLWLDAGCRGAVEVGDEDDFVGP
jgi:hypothetical protein